MYEHSIEMKSLFDPIVLFKRPLCIFLCIMSFITHSETAQDYEKALIAFNKEEFRESYVYLKNALQKNPQHLPSKLLIGRIFLIDGYPDAAITEFEEIVQAGADPNLVVLPLANAYLMNGQFEKIIDLVIPSNANRATQLDIELLKANAFIQKNEYHLAESQFQRARKRYGDDIRVINGLAQIALLNKDLVNARFTIDQALTINPDNPQSRQLSGLMYQAQKQYDQALIEFEIAYQNAPKDPAIMRALASSYAQAGDIAKASKLVGEIENQSPGSLQTKLLKARLLAMSEKNIEADVVLTELSQTLSLADKANNQNLAKISVVAGIIAHLNGNYDVSVRELNRYLNKEEPSAEIVAMLAEGYVRTNDSKSATQLLERHEKLILDNIQIASLLCDLYLSKNNVFKCDSLVQQLKERHGEDSQDVLLLEAKIINRRKYPEKALNILQTKLADNKKPDTILFRASLLASIGRYQESLIDAQSLLKTAPEKLDYQLLNIDLFIRLEDFEQANTLLETLLQQSPNNLAGLIHQSRIRFASGDFQGAHTNIQKVLENDKANFAALLLNGQILIKQNRLNDAIDQLIAAKTINPTSASPRELLISIYKQQNTLNLAISELNQLLKIRPSEPEYIYEKAKIYLATNEPEKAKSELDLLSFQWAEQPKKLLQLSHLQIASNDNIGAENSLKLAQVLAPKDLIIQLDYANFLLTTKAYSKADMYIQKMQKSFPNNSNVELIKGHYFKETKDLESAFVHYYNAYSLSPNYALALIELYKLANQNVHRTDIIKIFGQKVELQPEAHFIRHLYADLLFTDGEMSAANRHYEMLIQVDDLPNKANIFNNLANIVSNIDMAKAISYAKEAVKLNPNSSSILDTQGWLYSLNNNHQQGLDILRQAFTLNSDNPTIRYHLAYTLHKLGRTLEAKSELEFALQSSQKFEERTQAQALFLELGD